MEKYFSVKTSIAPCDNQAIFQVFSSGKSKPEFLPNVLREIGFLAAVIMFQLKGQFSLGSSNKLADMGFEQ